VPSNATWPSLTRWDLNSDYSDRLAHQGVVRHPIQESVPHRRRLRSFCTWTPQDRCNTSCGSWSYRSAVRSDLRMDGRSHGFALHPFRQPSSTGDRGDAQARERRVNDCIFVKHSCGARRTSSMTDGRAKSADDQSALRFVRFCRCKRSCCYGLSTFGQGGSVHHASTIERQRRPDAPQLGI
jgi:hypothetical protein